MKIPTLLFGAGPGACQYMENNTLEREFIGFIDNDKAKHGANYADLPVYGPEQISQLPYKEIVITTQWAMEVHKQLIEELCIPESKVVLPNKNQLKKATPFQHSDTRELARNIVLSLSRFAAKTNFPLIVDFGTLLGLVRDKDIIEWDDDIDFSVPVELASQTEAMLTEYIRENELGIRWNLERVVDKNERMAGLLLKFSDPGFVAFTTSICFRENRDGQSLHLPSLGMWFAPQEHFSNTEVITWQDETIRVPFAHEQYLTFQYGDWKTPLKNMQLSDYANLNQVDFADIQKAGIKAQTVEHGQ